MKSNTSTGSEHTDTRDTHTPTVAKGVYHVKELAKRLGMSERQVHRARAAGTFPIREIPALDSRPRWAVSEVEKFLSRKGR